MWVVVVVMRLVGGPPTECETVSTKVREQKCLVSILGIFGFFDETAHQWRGRHNHSRNSSEITCLDVSSHARHRVCTYTTPTHSKNGADKYAQTTRNAPHQNGFCGCPIRVLGTPSTTTGFRKFMQGQPKVIGHRADSEQGTGQKQVGRKGRTVQHTAHAGVLLRERPCHNKSSRYANTSAVKYLEQRYLIAARYSDLALRLAG